ncbi:5'-nucleotidase, lipoprotein e(P4) family [Pelagicoccus albus]|uniref:Acid phosphatase n=1 Tax=Pelagicoccus albus TaxID=415222 RepID=A0A7X1EAD9_9BACT|nr:HAD family acid phosphatase [Pelagicoccus albus]MBC2606682.1 acid phosphatase [Pelagicoccus albus]
MRFSNSLKLCSLLIASQCFLAPHAHSSELREDPDSTAKNNLMYAVAWKQTAAEYRALYFQGFNMARMRLDAALAKRDEYDKPLAIVTDVDDTLLLTVDYWGHLITEGDDFFDDTIWDEWIPENRLVPTPGSLDFIQYCREQGVEVFYVTSRNQGEETYSYAVGNLEAAGFPDVTEERLTVLLDTSNKQAVQDEIAQEYEIVLFLGDNLNDFRRKYYSKDVDERMSLMEEDKAEFGSRYILFPNPTDGHWIRAIYGDSEPPPSDENRGVLMKAATRKSWQPDAE